MPPTHTHMHAKVKRCSSRLILEMEREEGEWDYSRDQVQGLYVGVYGAHSYSSFHNRPFTCGCIHLLMSRVCALHWSSTRVYAWALTRVRPILYASLNKRSGTRVERRGFRGHVDKSINTSLNERGDTRRWAFLSLRDARRLIGNL